MKNIARVWNCLADCPAMSFVFVCWHSRKWWPPIRLGTLQLAVLRLEKINWTDFCCCKNGISYTNCQWKSKKQDKRRETHSKKRWSDWFCFLQVSTVQWLWWMVGRARIPHLVFLVMLRLILHCNWYCVARCWMACSNSSCTAPGDMHRWHSSALQTFSRWSHSLR